MQSFRSTVSSGWSWREPSERLGHVCAMAWIHGYVPYKIQTARGYVSALVSPKGARHVWK